MNQAADGACLFSRLCYQFINRANVGEIAGCIAFGFLAESWGRRPTTVFYFVGSLIVVPVSTQLPPTPPMPPTVKSSTMPPLIVILP